MTEKELRRLSRVDLLEMLIAQSTELQECKEKLEAAEEALKNREIAVRKAGSIAEASLVLNGVFEAADRACQQYIENIRKYSENREIVCDEMEEQSRLKAQQIISDAEEKSRDMLSQTEKECADMKNKAKEESRRYWEKISSMLEEYYDTHAGLRELLSSIDIPKNME